MREWKLMHRAGRFYLGLFGALAMLLSAGTFARADVVYQVDSWPPPGPDWEIFNNSQGDEVEDNWVANSFQVIAGGTRLTSIMVRTGSPWNNYTVCAVIYLGSDLMNPSAGGGLMRVATTNTTITAGSNTLVTIPLDSPVDLAVDQIFYAALLLPGIPGSTFPFTTDHAFTHPEMSPPVLGQSFFDVGPTQGAPYDLDMTQNATVLGATHPVVGDGVQDPGNLVLRVGATDTP